MHDENRVFDVSRPSKVSPPPTSRPVIVGHHPMNDPMVREDGFGTEPPMPATKIPVVSDGSAGDGSMTVEQALAAHQAAETPQPSSSEPTTQGSPAIFSDHNEEASQAPAVVEPTPPNQSVGEGPFTDMEPKPTPGPQSDLPPPAPHQEPDIEGLHFAEPKPKRGRMKWVLASLLVLLIAGYLVIDSGLVNAGFELPFHIFKQKDKATPAPAASNTPQPASSGPALPTGFKEYKLADTNLNFAAPLAWGEATSVTDPGYSKRGGTNKPDGVFAYLVNFAANKNVQIAVTSAKYLPASRPPNYYDYLQWCTGTSDGQIYESILNFSTVNKVDTPTTITCSQGPVPIVSKLNSTTIIQTQAKDTAGKVIGDIYTLNLEDPTLVVFRVKDISMTNGTDIRQLLDTVKLTSASTSQSSNP